MWRLLLCPPCFKTFEVNLFGVFFWGGGGCDDFIVPLFTLTLANSPVRAPDFMFRYLPHPTAVKMAALNFTFSPPRQNMVAVPLGSVIVAFHLCLVQLSHGGAYYGRKQPPQPLPQYNDGFPQQPTFKGNEMPRVAFGKDVPLLPQYGKELPQLPLQMGKERPPVLGKGSYRPPGQG